MILPAAVRSAISFRNKWYILQYNDTSVGREGVHISDFQINTIPWVKTNYSSELKMAMLLSNLTLLMTLSLRAQYAIENVPINQLHGSSTTSDAQKELEFFFPEEQTFALIRPDAAKTHKGKAFRKYGLYLVM